MSSFLYILEVAQIKELYFNFFKANLFIYLFCNLKGKKKKVSVNVRENLSAVSFPKCCATIGVGPNWILEPGIQFESLMLVSGTQVLGL